MSLFTSIAKKWLILPAFILLAWPNGAFAYGNLEIYASTTPNYVCTVLSVSQSNPTPYDNGTRVFRWVTATGKAQIDSTGTFDSSGSSGVLGGGSGGSVGQICKDFSAITDGLPYYLAVNYRSNYPSAGTHTVYWLSPAVYRSGGVLSSTFTEVSNFVTRIDSVYPANEDILATTTPTGAELALIASGYVASTTELTDLQIKWDISSLTTQLMSADSPAGTPLSGEYIYYSDIGSSQSFDVYGNTGNIPIGHWDMITSIIKPKSYFGISSIFGYNFGYDTLVSTTTNFIISANTPADDIVYGAGGLAEQLAIHTRNLTATTTAGLLDSCNVFSFNLSDCLYTLFLPSMADLRSTLTELQNGFLDKAPWGYGTRLFKIITNNATTTASTALPTWVVTFPSIQGASGSPLAGTTITFDMQDMLDQGSTTLNSITDPISGKTIRQIVEPYILLFIAISALIIIFHDLMGMGNHKNTYADK